MHLRIAVLFACVTVACSAPLVSSDAGGSTTASSPDTGASAGLDAAPADEGPRDPDARAPDEDAGRVDEDASAPRDATPGDSDPAPSPDAGAPSGDAGPAGPTEDCARYPFSRAVLMSELIGFAQRTTGGDRGNLYRVTSRANSGPGTLRDALESPVSRYVVFDVEGEFRLTTRIRVGSNKTVDGRGRDVRIVGDEGVFDIRAGTRNLIFTDLDLSMNMPEDNSGDVIGIRGRGGPLPSDFESRDFWFHHLALHYGGDGLLDVRGGTSITLSWSHLYYHTKALLHTVDDDDNFVAGMHITYHHNFFDTLSRRGPHFAGGKADFFNNYQLHWYEYGAASVDEAQFLSEANIYEARPGRFCVPSCPDPSPHGGGNDFRVSKVALSTDWAVRQSQGFSRSVGDLLENDAVVSQNQPSRVFQRGTYYPATPEVADQALKQRIRAGAGPRVAYCR